jgi:membrane associated rhomboid family serine protease
VIKALIRNITKRRVLNLIVGVCAVLSYETARVFYRPFVRANDINDWYIADTLGNSLGTVGAVFGMIAILGRNEKQDRFLINVMIISVLIYEIAHPLLGKPMDPADVVATLVAGGFCVALYRLLHGKQLTTVDGGETTNGSAG